MNILGINAYHGNASAAVVCDGRLVAAVEEERFNRVKYAAGFPAQAIRYCLKEAGLELKEIDHVAVPRNPYARLGTKLFYALRMPSFARGRAKVPAKFTGIREALAAAFDSDPKAIAAEFHRVEHHQAHLASAFFVSPFERAALLSADGLGDFASTMWGSGSGNHMEIADAIAFPHSLGLYYTAVTQYLGFLKFGDEYKVMGLAAYGEPERLETFRDIVRFNADGNSNGFRLGLDYFVHHRTGPEMSWAEAGKTPTLGRLFSEEMSRTLGAARAPEEPLEQCHRNLAASLQARLEEVYLGMLSKLAKASGLKSICLAGGVAFNCVANGKIFDGTPFEQVFVQPAAGDGGLAVGAANEARGLAREGYGVAELPLQELTRRAAAIIADGKILGWFQGRAEWGPRALGNRSIVADPRRSEMKDVLNRRIKHREIFRPFAPSILAEKTSEWFEQSHPSPFMTMAYAVKKEMRDKIPAPTHVDGTGRLQTVTQTANPRYWKLIRAFEQQTGVPVVLNTSFNDNEPIVCKPQEAIDCFARTQMDALVLGDFLITREDTSGQRRSAITATAEQD